MTATRIYAVRTKPPIEANPPVFRLIRATNPAQVGRHIIKDTLDITVASQDDLVDALASGAKVEDASAEPSTNDKESFL